MRASNDAVVHFAALGAPWLPAGRFPDGAESIGLPSIGEWQAILSYTGHDGRLLAVDPNRYPRHFRVLSGFHRERSRLPRAPAVRPLDWGGSRAASFTARLASGAASGVTGNVEVHIDARSNAAVATIAMSPTGGWQAWVSKTASMSGVSGVHTVYLVFTSSGTSDFTNVNYFTFGQAGNDFSVSVSPSSASVSAGKSATANVNTTVTSGSAQTVTLSASGAPPGASVSFSPSSVTAGGSSTMTVATSSSVAPASYPVTVTGSGASATHSATFTLTVTGAGSSGALSNGGFESGSLSPWTCQSGDMVVTSPVHSGSYALQVTPTSSQTGECDQAVTLSPNTSYTLTGWVLGNYAYIGVSGGASASNWTSSSSWSKLSVSFTTGSSGNVTVYVHGWYAQGNVYADDFTLS